MIGYYCQGTEATRATYSVTGGAWSTDDDFSQSPATYWRHGWRSCWRQLWPRL